MAKFPFCVQPDNLSCGPTSLWLISLYYGKKYNLEDLIREAGTGKTGTSLLNLSNIAEKLGFRTLGAKLSFEQLNKSIHLPCIVYWNPNHFVVVYKIKKNKVYISDPSHGLLTYSKEEFISFWTNEGDNVGIVLLLEPSAEFYDKNKVSNVKLYNQKAFKFLIKYLIPYKKLYLQLFVTLLIGSLLQLIFPFLTQNIVDIGIKNQDLHAIYLILFAQLMLVFSTITVEVFRAWLLIKMSSRINISMVSDFFSKLMRLPISYFDTKMTGDIMQRIYDNHRIEQFLTGSSLRTLFSMVSLVIFAGVLAWYNLQILIIFLVGSALYFYWIIYFFKRKAEIDYKMFSLNSQNQNKVIELINGMQEVKLYNAERKKRWEWQTIQDKIFQVNLKSLNISQVQNTGANLLNEFKNILITFLAAKLVIEGKLTLGMMLSISYIIGQLNGPVLDLVNFIQQWQYAKLSIERLSEIQEKDEEEKIDQLTEISDLNSLIKISNLSFKYRSLDSDLVLKNLNLTIYPNKVTAIIGASGSGKSTLMKILLKFYEPLEGNIHIGNTVLKNLSAQSWRRVCGSVMQDGYIFSDSIENNIAVGEGSVDIAKLHHAAKMANILEFIEKLPEGFHTKIGIQGVGLSTGQKQRILIARVIYKNPKYLFFDEATNSLDAENEKVVIGNLNEFFKNKTVVVIAHRLSTVRDADQIIVLNKGCIVEQGTHEELISKEGYYFELVKNQLELGN
jgi:ATP-binding cassette subfamily B protein